VINMIAEIHGKLSSTGSNLHDRLEDNLTGDVFGSLRYIPYNMAMKQILENAIYPRSLASLLKDIQANFWKDNIRFWPYDEEGELDALFEFEDIVIGIEVKFLSGLSSDDNIDYSETTIEKSSEEEKKISHQQLSREARIVAKVSNKKKKLLIFIADSLTCSNVYEDTIKRDLIKEGVELGYITWQSFFHELTKLKLENEFYNLIIEDLIKLLKRKKLDRFKDMNLDVDFTVDPSSYFHFNHGVKDTINFHIDTKIRGDLHYEFK
jgi:hypothetical protein